MITNIIKDTIIQIIQDHLIRHAVIIALATMAIIIAMAIDLASGVKKARQLGIARTSAGYKKTCDKARKYFSPLLVLTCIDFVAAIIIPLPLFTMIWTLWCLFCEFTSVREKAWQKAELRRAERTFNVILENKENPINAVAQTVFGTKEANNNKKEDTSQ